MNKTIKTLLAILRLGMGWLFLWAFMDKLWGLGFATKAEDAWVSGGSPTFGFLNFSVKGPFAEFYQSLAGNPVLDWVFMVGLLLIGLALLLGIGMNIACYSGALLVFLMYTAGFIPPEHNPFLDDHLMYPILMILLATTQSGNYFGFGNWWRETDLVKRFKFLA